MFSRSLGLVTKVGPAVSRQKFPELSTKFTDFAIEVEMMDGDRALLELSQNGATELAEELQKYLKVRGSR